MSTLAFMKVLESSPSRYDKGINIITLGKIIPLYKQLVENIRPQMQVLDIGCGTGIFTLLAAQKNAVVTGIDINPDMLSIAEKRMNESEIEISFKEMGIAELDQENEAKYDCVFSGLVFSELSEDEINFTLHQIKRILKSDGIFLFVDEIWPTNWLLKIVAGLIKLPILLLTYLFTQTTTSTVKDPCNKVLANGFKIEKCGTKLFGSLLFFVARNDA